jgi:hypothetical protein
MKQIISFTDKYIVADEQDMQIAEFSNKEDAVNYIVQQDNVNPENIIENPFYEVDEHGQLIG